MKRQTRKKTRHARVKQYLRALDNCPAPGTGVHGWILGTANYAANAGIDQARAIDDIIRAMTRFPSPSSEVAEAVGKAYREKVLREAGLGVDDAGTSFAKAKPNPQLIQKFVVLGGDVTEEDLRNMAPVQLDWGNNPVAEAEAQLLALFRPGELVCCGDWHAKEVQEREVTCKSKCYQSWQIHGGGGISSYRTDNDVFRKAGKRGMKGPRKGRKRGERRTKMRRSRQGGFSDSVNAPTVGGSVQHLFSTHQHARKANLLSCGCEEQNRLIRPLVQA